MLARGGGARKMRYDAVQIMHSRAERLQTLAVFAAAAALMGWGIGRGSVFNGDDALYAQFVREMRERGDLLHLRLDGAIIHQRPPLYPWLLWLSTAIFGETIFALRLPAVLAAAGCAALTFRLGLRVFSPVTAAIAGALLPTLGMEFLYARSVTSDTTLAFFILLAMVLYLDGRHLAAGAAMGLALMTKQVVGLMPLLAPAAAFLAGGRGALPPARRLLGALGVTLAVLAPWHLAMTAMHGGRFWAGYLGWNVLHRASTSVLSPTSADFYLGVLWRKEREIVLVALVGLAVVAVRAARRRTPEDVLLLLWPLAVLGAFTLARSRFDYYLLPAYPALALLLAAPLELVAARRAALAGALGVALIAGSVALHVPQRMRAPDPFVELRSLAERMRELSRPDDPLYCIEEMYLLPRYYSHRPTYYVIVNKRYWESLQGIEIFREPGTVLFWPSRRIPERLAEQPRWYAIQRKETLDDVPPPRDSFLAAQTPRYVLYTNVPPPGP